MHELHVQPYKIAQKPQHRLNKIINALDLEAKPKIQTVSPQPSRLNLKATPNLQIKQIKTLTSLRISRTND